MDGLTKYLAQTLRDIREASRRYEGDARLDAAKIAADAALSRYFDALCVEARIDHILADD
jgi:hypothetical protein